MVRYPENRHYETMQKNEYGSSYKGGGDMKALGLDIGTTTISAAVLDREDGSVCDAKTVANQCFIDHGNEWERIQDVDRIMEKALAVANEMIDTWEDIGTIGLTGQMHGILYFDEDGNCVSPLYTWQDGRGNLKEDGGHSVVEEIRDICGIWAASGYGLVTHIYNRRHGLVPESAVGFCTIGDYLGMKLTGRKKPLMHAGMADSTGLFDAQKACYRTDALEKLGMSADLCMLPEVREDFAKLGEFRGRPVTAAIGDNQAAFLGSAGFTPNAVLVNMGTGGQISILSDQYFTAPGIEARPFTPGRYLLAGSALCGGRAYAILEKFFRAFAQKIGAGSEPLYDVLGSLAEEGMQLEDPMRAVTTFAGTRVDPSLRGSISNISEDNFTPASLTWAIMDGMAQELYQMYETIHEGTGITADHLIASGNGLRMNPMLQEMFRKKFGVDLSMSRYKEEAACGAAVSSYTEM